MNKPIPELQGDDLMPFGKFQGSPMRNVPMAYYRWLWVKVGYGSFSRLVGDPGRIALYIHKFFKWEFEDGDKGKKLEPELRESRRTRQMWG